MSTFKTSDPAMLAAVASYCEQRSQLRAASKAFRLRFGAKDALTTTGFSQRRFAGLVFSPPMDRRFWTVPDRESKIQRPRERVARMTADEKVAHAALLEEWRTHLPTLTADVEPIYAAMGASWGDFFFTGLTWFLYDGTVYAKTDAKLKAPMVEILGSEYELAYEALQAADKAEKQLAAAESAVAA